MICSEDIAPQNGGILHTFHWTKKWICTNLLFANMWQICQNSGVKLAWVSGVSGGKGEKWKRKRERALLPPPPSPIKNLVFPISLGRPDTQARVKRGKDSLRGRRKKGRGGGRKGKSPSPFSLPLYPLPPTPFDACYAGYGKDGKCHICLVIYTPWYANVAFTIFAPDLLLSVYKATCDIIPRMKSVQIHCFVQGLYGGRGGAQFWFLHLLCSCCF